MATPTNLSEYYSGKGSTLPATAEGRFADPAFASAAKAAGYDSNSYKVNMGNAQANTSILGHLLGTPPKNNLVVSSGSANSEFNNHSSELTKMLTQLGGVQNPNPSTSKDTPTLDNTNDPYTRMLDSLSKTSDASTKALIGTIHAARANRGNALNTQYQDYKQGLQLLGIQHNEAQATPDLLMGHIKQAENEHQQKLQALDIETNKALMDAEKAQKEGDLSILKEKMNYVKELKAEKQNVLKNIADNLSYETKIADTEAAQYYDKLNTLNPQDKEAFLTALAKKFNISLGSLTRAMVTEKDRREKAALDIADKKSIIANRGKKTGSGTGTSAGKGGTDGTYTYTADELAQYKSILNSGGTAPDGYEFAGRGDDDYVDPYAYNYIYKEWKRNGGTTTGFLKKFPISNINPDKGYDIINADLKPKKKNSGGSDGL